MQMSDPVELRGLRDGGPFPISIPSASLKEDFLILPGQREHFKLIHSIFF